LYDLDLALFVLQLLVHRARVNSRYLQLLLIHAELQCGGSFGLALFVLLDALPKLQRTDSDSDACGSACR
jgi:hypothetical protein